MNQRVWNWIGDYLLEIIVWVLGKEIPNLRLQCGVVEKALWRGPLRNNCVAVAVKTCFEIPTLEETRRKNCLGEPTLESHCGCCRKNCVQRHRLLEIREIGGNSREGLECIWRLIAGF